MRITLEVARFLIFRNREVRFLLPVREMRNWNRKMIPFTIPLITILVPIPPKYPSEPEL